MKDRLSKFEVVQSLTFGDCMQDEELRINGRTVGGLMKLGRK